MKQLILLAEPINEHARPLEDLLAVLVGILRAFGYSDQYTLTQKEVYFSEKAEEHDNG